MKKTVLFLNLLLSGWFAMAQNDPVKWTFSAKKLDDKTYEVTMTANVASPWHIYSQTTPAGGPLPTDITYNKNPLLSLEGEAKEKGNITRKYESVFEVDVVYFNGSVSFVQIVKLKAKAKTKLSGIIEYMVCNDTQCLPPKKVPFSIEIK